MGSEGVRFAIEGVRVWGWGHISMHECGVCRVSPVHVLGGAGT